MSKGLILLALLSPRLASVHGVCQVIKKLKSTLVSLDLVFTVADHGLRVLHIEVLPSSLLEVPKEPRDSKQVMETRPLGLSPYQ